MPFLSAGRWVLAAVSASMVGLSKSGVPGLGSLFVPLFALVLPARASTGALLPLLIVGDIFAVAFWRRHAVWRHLVRLLPWAMAGVVLGWLAMGRVDDATMRPLLGGLVILMLGVNLWRDLAARAAKAAEMPAAAGTAEASGSEESLRVPDRWWFAAMFGVAAGFTTMIANAAGAIMTVYLLAMRLPKERFIGTAAWYFLIINCLKVPFSASLGLINPSSLLLDAALAGLVVLGSFAGLAVAHRIPQRAFGIVVQVLTFAAAVMMFF